MQEPKLKLRLEQDNIHREIIDAAGGNLLAAKILYGRGYDSALKVKDFFLESYIPVCTKDIGGIGTAVRRVGAAIEKGEKICVYGDYDVDGVTSTVILTECLQELGADFIYHVPDRFSEGYGMNKEVIQSLAAGGVKLIITCDCGISSIEEVELSNQLGMDVIVTDHHTPPENLPPAFCIINPKLYGAAHKAYNVSGAVVAYYLARAVSESVKKVSMADKFSDLLALSIIADVVPLTGENRYLLIRGLEAVRSTSRPGLKSLLKTAGDFGAPLDEEFIGYQITPRINAAGRLDSARRAIELLTVQDSGKAEQLAQELNSLNKRRKEIEAEISKEARELAETRLRNKRIFAIYNKDWHHGVIGIAAGKLCERYGKPVILLTLKEDGKTVVGSARAPEGISIYEILKACEDRLTKFGGHSSAAGLSLELAGLNKFIQKVETVAWEHEGAETSVNVDVEFSLDNIGEETAGQIKVLGPFGEGFEQPVFLCRNINIVSNMPIKTIGRRLAVCEKEKVLQGVYWNDAGFDEVCGGIDIVFNINESHFKGKNETKLNVQYLIRRKEQEKDRRSIKLKNVIDMRLKDDYEPEAGDTVYYEGISKQIKVKTYNRYEIAPAENLVLYSTPPSLEVLKQVLKTASPGRLTIVFRDSRQSGRELIEKILGVIKFIISKKQGKTSYTELASVLGMTSDIVETAVKYFYYSGLIEYEETYDELVFYKGTGRKAVEAEKYGKELANLIEEMNAFRDYMHSTAAGNIIGK